MMFKLPIVAAIVSAVVAASLLIRPSEPVVDTIEANNDVYGYYNGVAISKRQFDAMVREGSRYADEKYLREELEKRLSRR